MNTTEQEIIKECWECKDCIDLRQHQYVCRRKVFPLEEARAVDFPNVFGITYEDTED